MDRGPQTCPSRRSYLGHCSRRHPWTSVELPTAMLGKIFVGRHFAGAIGAAGEPQSTIPGRPKLQKQLFFSGKTMIFAKLPFSRT